MNIEIITPDGVHKDIAINKFPAMEGWDIQANFRRFAASDDKEFRKAYTMEILGYAEVVIGPTTKMPFKTAAVIENHLGSWQNIERVFNEVMMQNGIDPKTHADTPHYWDKVGEQIAIAIVAKCSELVGPALEAMNKTE
jgi:hypothetical protein